MKQNGVHIPKGKVSSTIYRLFLPSPNKNKCRCPKRRLSCARGSMLPVPLLIGGMPGAFRYVDTYVRRVDSAFCMSGTAKV